MCVCVIRGCMCRRLLREVCVFVRLCCMYCRFLSELCVFRGCMCRRLLSEVCVFVCLEVVCVVDAVNDVCVCVCVWLEAECVLVVIRDEPFDDDMFDELLMATQLIDQMLPPVNQSDQLVNQ